MLSEAQRWVALVLRCYWQRRDDAKTKHILCKINQAGFKPAFFVLRFMLFVLKCNPYRSVTLYIMESQFLNDAPIAIVTTQRDQVIISANTACCALLHQKPT